MSLPAARQPGLPGEPIYAATLAWLKWEHASCVSRHTCSHAQPCEALWVVFMEAKTLAKVSLPLPASYRGNAVLSSDVSLVLPELGTVLRSGPNAHIGIAVLDAAYTRAEGGTVIAARLLVQVSIWRTQSTMHR